MVLFVLFGAVAAQAQESTQKLPTLTTTRAAHELSLHEAARHYPVRLKAVVTYYDPYIDARRPAFFVSDATGGVFVALAQTPAVGFKAGDLVEVTGESGAGDYAPIVEGASARRVGVSHLPETAPRVSMTNLLAGAYDGQWVEIEGLVHAIRESDKNVFLDIVMSDGVIRALTVKQPSTDYGSLVDAKVLLRGNAAPTFNHQGQLTGSHMLFPGLSTLRIEEPAPTDPLAAPVNPVNGLLRFEPNTAFHHRVHVQGTATLYWPGRLLCVQDRQEGLCAQTEQTSPLRTGELVDLIGFPVIGEFTPTLLQTSFQGEGGQLPLHANRVTAAEAMDGRHDASLVTIEGQLIGQDRAANDPTLLLSAGDFIFTAVLPQQPGTGAMPAVDEGSWVRITGICSVQTDGSVRTTGAGFPIPKSFRILMRSPADVAVVIKPSWWNAEHTLRVLAVALAIALAALASAVILWTRVRRQTEVIHSQLLETSALKDAAEAAHKAADFQATHDALTGVLNRRAIFDAMRREFDLALRSGATTGLVMLDLDHFKRVNDTYGHFAGDEVLKEAVRRVLLAVRSTDLVGRYGGEEFLIVLPNCDRDQLLGCAERVRMAICGKKMEADGQLLAMTASLGAVVADPRPSVQTEALKIADAALYQAKNSGRNRAVLKDLESEGAAETLRPVLERRA